MQIWTNQSLLKKIFNPQELVFMKTSLIYSPINLPSLPGYDKTFSLLFIFPHLQDHLFTHYYYYEIYLASLRPLAVERELKPDNLSKEVWTDIISGRLARFNMFKHEYTDKVLQINRHNKQ